MKKKKFLSFCWADDNLGLFIGKISQVIIDSQPLTVAILAALLFGESIGIVGAAGLVLGVIGLLLLEASLQIPVSF